MERTLRQNPTASHPPGFDLVWGTHRERVWRLLVRLTGSRDVADDLTQEVALRAAEGYPRFRGRAMVFTYLYRIALNVAFGWQRSRREPSLPLAMAEAVPTTDFDTLAIRTALDTLDPDFRAVIVLRVYEGLSYEEIARVLEIPVGTVMSRLHRARKLLREELSDELS